MGFKKFFKKAKHSVSKSIKKDVRAIKKAEKKVVHAAKPVVGSIKKKVVKPVGGFIKKKVYPVVKSVVKEGIKIAKSEEETFLAGQKAIQDAEAGLGGFLKQPGSWLIVGGLALGALVLAK